VIGEVVTKVVVMVDIQVFRGITPCSLVNSCRHFKVS